MKTKQDIRRHIVMSVFSMTKDSGFSIELTAYVIGIKQETVIKILDACKDEYKNYLTGIYKKHHL
tara:strand:- start:2274 stop:2468 length:195 start_codon:yes stop_codon:yes gene_type:complete